MKYDKMVKKVQKILILIILISVPVYTVKRHTDTVVDLAQSFWRVISSPLATLNDIRESKNPVGFPPGSLEIFSLFKEKLPEEKTFFMGEALGVEPLFSQRAIEYNFPLLWEKNARCGFAANDDKAFDSYQVIEKKEIYQIVCRR